MLNVIASIEEQNVQTHVSLSAELFQSNFWHIDLKI